MTNQPRKCSICGELTKMTKEHWPPRSCYNNTPIFKIDLYKKVKLVDGFYEYTLCRKCNNDTGNYYINNGFKDFIHQAMDFMNKEKMTGNEIYSNSYTFKPLNTLKEIIVGFFSSEKTDLLKNDRELVDFIKNKENQFLPEKYRIFIYYTNKKGRQNGYSTIFDMKSSNHTTILERVFLPFGYVMIIEDDELNMNINYFEISNFKNYKYDYETTINLDIPFLIPSGVLSGRYENLSF